jgi:hypothetical protein
LEVRDRVIGLRYGLGLGLRVNLTVKSRTCIYQIVESDVIDAHQKVTLQHTPASLHETRSW